MMATNDYYSSIALGYDELHGEEQKRKLRLILDCIPFTSKELVLDVGCGTGIATRVLPSKVIGIDPSFGLLLQAPFPVACGKAESLPFKDKVFDKAISLTAFHHVEDPLVALQEMRRVTKKEIILTILKKSPRATALVHFLHTLCEIHKKLDDLHDHIFVIGKISSSK